jgi:pseudouridine-5'-phosphate glycosidase/pseudouridine kinase
MTVPRLVASLNRGYIASRSRINSGSIRSCGFFVQTRNKTDRRGFASSTRRQTSADLSGLRDVLRISEEVADAVATNKPVVALESTIYTHGAFQEDLGLEQVVRELGAVPAVCGVYNGVATVGLEKHEIQEMVHGDAAKISRRDLAVIVGDGLRGVKRHGGTTIAGTMILARLAGIRVFGTGGLGGVHRGVQNSMDISADLTELGRTRVAVICSGCKGFLDIPRTLEYLETQGAVVSTFNTAGEPNANVTFPAFWARNSGVKSPSHLQGPEDAAYRIYAQEKLGLESGLLLANPIPAEAAIPSEVMEDAIKCAVKDAKREGFTGSDNTPFVLQRIKEYTEGRSVGANLALVRSNVAMAARVAQCLSNILQNGPSAISSHTLSSSDEKPM